MSDYQSLGDLFLKDSVRTFHQQKELAEKAVAQLSDEQLHEPLDENTNSAAIIMKHVAGNLISRWTEFLTTDGEKPWRNRDGEFIDNFRSSDEVLTFWERGWKCLFDALSALSPVDLEKTITIRDEPHSVVLAIHSGGWVPV